MDFEKLAESISTYHPDPDLDKVKKAYEFAKESHKNQKRKSGEPYFLHLFETSLLVCKLRLDISSVIAGLLHDTVEDCDIDYKTIEDKFGPDVAHIVEGVTNLKKIQFSSKEEKQAESFRKMLVAMSKDIRVILVKLCDRLHNMRTLNHLPDEKKIRKALETKEIYAPIANRLGIDWLKSELEDLCLLNLRPELFHRIKSKFEQSDEDRKKFVKDTCEEIVKLLESSGVSASVKGRGKHLYSIWQKMEKNNLAFEEVHDALGFRIIVPTIRSCYEVLGIVHAAWKPVPGRFKDYVAMPKANMYQSLHTTVIGPGGNRIEIQIRTPEMNRIANEGIAAHWRYKEGEGTKGFDLKWVSELVENQQYLRNPEEFIQSVKGELFPDDVFVFTPKGDLIRLPNGSCPVDFAYSIHTDVGNRTTAAKVNGLIVSLNHVLENGDTVEIVTRKDQKPSKDWLTYVKSSKAKQRIRVFLRSAQKERAQEIGSEIISKDLKKIKLSLSKLEKSGEMQKAASKMGYQSFVDLYCDLSYGKITSAKVISLLQPNETDVEKRLKSKPSPLQRIFQTAARATRKKVGVKVSGLDDIVVRFANCCEPLPGDRIVGFITRGRGVTIHHVDCAHILSADPLRIVNVHWDDEIKSSRKIKLNVHSHDKIGILANLSTKLLEHGLNVKSAEISTTDFGKALISFEIEIEDAKQLNKVTRSIEGIPDVIKVERIKYLNKKKES